jgi:hypothetical protein
MQRLAALYALYAGKWLIRTIDARSKWMMGCGADSILTSPVYVCHVKTLGASPWWIM